MNNKSLKKLRMSSQKIEQVMAWLQETMEEEYDHLQYHPEAFTNEEERAITEKLDVLDENIGMLNVVLQAMNDTFQH